MSKELNILFIPVSAVGHVNGCIGLAEVLIQSGHSVSFAVNHEWEGRLAKYGIREILYNMQNEQGAEHGADHGAQSTKAMAKMMIEVTGLGKDSTPLDKAVNMVTKMGDFFVSKIKQMDDQVSRVIASVQPDVLFVDMPTLLPSVVKSGIPWVLVSTANPLRYLSDERTPPALSGLPTNGDKNEWKIFRDKVKEVNKHGLTQFNAYLNENGIKNLNENVFMLMQESPYFNIYGYPLELDYIDIKQLPPNWYRFDNLKRTEQHIPFEIPIQLKDRPGKLIYFSLGSMGAADVDNMKRLVNILSKSKHRFIVSKGPLHNEYSLADNMWGEGSVPQIQVLPLVDLVITHGGNNTVTETFYFGKPMIVLPLWTDQYDNAQRVHEKGFGIRLDAYKCSDKELLNAIEKLLNDNILNQNLQNISQRIQSENSIARLPEIIDKLVKGNGKNNN